MALPIDEVVLDFCQLGAPDPETDMVPRPAHRHAARAGAHRRHRGREGEPAGRPGRPLVVRHAAGHRRREPRRRGDHRPRRAPDHDRHPRPRRAEAGPHAGPRRREAHRAARRPAEHHRRSRPNRPSASPASRTRTRRSAGRSSRRCGRCSPRSAPRSATSARPTTRAPIERISLTGGGSQLRGIAAALEEQIGLPTRVVDPMQHIRNRLASKQARAADPTHVPSAVSVGLAMGAAA